MAQSHLKNSLIWNAVVPRNWTITQTAAITTMGRSSKVTLILCVLASRSAF